MARPQNPPTLGLFKDRWGKVSMMRLALFAWAFGGFVVWIIISLKSGKVEDFPASVAAIISTLAASKAAQTFAEG